MTWLTRVCLALGLIIAQLAPAQDLPPGEQGLSYYLQEDFDEAAPLLAQAYERAPDEGVLKFLLADSYYRLNDYARAEPLLSDFLETYSGDLAVRFLLAEALLGLDRPEAALAQTQQLLARLARPAPPTVVPEPSAAEPIQEPPPTLDELSAVDLSGRFLADLDLSRSRALLLQGRAWLALGEQQRAIVTLEQALEGAEGGLAQDIGVELLPLYIGQDRLVEARTLAERAAGEAPDSFDANVLGALTARLAEPLSVTLGYRLALDGEPGAAPSQEFLPQGRFTDSDLKQQLFADLSGRFPLAADRDLFVEGYAAQSVNHAGSELNHTELGVTVGLGWSRPRYGFRLPLELSHERLAGNRFRSALALQPGGYYRLGANRVLYGFARLQYGDVDEDVAAVDDRSGYGVALGALLVWRRDDDRAGLRTLIETGADNAAGRNWERDRWRASLSGDLRLDEHWRLGAGLEYRDFRYDHRHSAAGVRREDSRWTLSLNARRGLGSGWRLELVASHQDANSNLDAYRYDRNLVSLGISREF